MADPTTHLPQTNEAIEAEILRVEAQLKMLKHAKPDQHTDSKKKSKSAKRKAESEDTIAPLTRPSKQSTPYLSLQHLEGDFSDIANMTPQQLAAEIAAVEHDLRQEYSKAYAVMFTDEAAVKAEMKRLQDEIDRHLATIDNITQPKSTKSKSSKPRKRSYAEVDTSLDSCICQLSITASDVPIQCAECKLRYHASCFTHLFAASGVAEPHHRVDALALYFVCPNHSVGSPSVRMKTPTEIEAEVSQIKDKRSIAQQLRDMEERLAQIKSLTKTQSRTVATVYANAWTDDDSAVDEDTPRSMDQSDDETHSDPKLVQRVRHLMKVLKLSQSDVVKQCQLMGGASAFSCWLNDRPIPQREKKEVTIRQWCDALEAKLAKQ